jgi:hypothetical protein
MHSSRPTLRATSARFLTADAPNFKKLFGAIISASL